MFCLCTNKEYLNPNFKQEILSHANIISLYKNMCIVCIQLKFVYSTTCKHILFPEYQNILCLTIFLKCSQFKHTK